jgi:hypothetical protein
MWEAFMREKERKTEHELEMLLRDRTKDLPVDRLKVRRDPIMGWSVAFVVRDRPVATECLPQFMEIERDLRRKFELAP